MKRSIVIAITGASGAIYATRTLAALLEQGCHIELVVSDYGRRLLRDELGDAATIDKLMDYLAATYGDGVVPLTQEDLAAMAGTSRATVNRVLREEATLDAVALARGRTTVLDPAALESRCKRRV